MTFAVVPFDRSHLEAISIQEGQSHLVGLIHEEKYFAALAACQARTALVDTCPVAIAGISSETPGRGTVWAIMGRDAGRHMVAITRAARDLMAARRMEFVRLEAAVRCDFVPAVRFVKLLGFRRECRMRKYFAGIDYFLYSIISEDSHG